MGLTEQQEWCIDSFDKSDRFGMLEDLIDLVSF